VVEDIKTPRSNYSARDSLRNLTDIGTVWFRCFRRVFEVSGGDKNPDFSCITDSSRFICRQQNHVCCATEL
jgi:hypothetical protein